MTTVYFTWLAQSKPETPLNRLKTFEYFDEKNTVGDYINMFGSKNTVIVYTPYTPQQSFGKNRKLIIINDHIHFWTLSTAETIIGLHIKDILMSINVSTGNYKFTSNDDATFNTNDLWLLTLLRKYAFEFFPPGNSNITSVKIVDKDLSFRTVYPLWDSTNSQSRGYSLSLAGENNISSLQLESPKKATIGKVYEWIRVRKDELVEIPDGVRSIKASMNSIFNLSNDSSSNIVFTDADTAYILSSIQFHKKPYYIMSTEDASLLCAKSDCIIKFSEEKCPVYTILSPDMDRRVKPNTDYKIYFDNNHDLYNFCSDTKIQIEGTNWSYVCVVSDKMGKLPKNTANAVIMFE